MTRIPNNGDDTRGLLLASTHPSRKKVSHTSKFIIGLTAPALVAGVFFIKADAMNEGSSPAPVQDSPLHTVSMEVTSVSEQSDGASASDPQTPNPVENSQSSVTLKVNGEDIPIPTDTKHVESTTEEDGSTNTVTLDVSVANGGVTQTSDAGPRTRIRINAESSVESSLNIKKEVKTKD